MPTLSERAPRLRAPLAAPRSRPAALLLLALALLLPALAGAQQAESPTTVILVRHAERAGDPSGDPLLTPAGEERAKSLVPVVKDAGVQAIITTQYRRTQLTARPAAEALGITPEVVAASGQDHPLAVARYIRDRHAGHTVLVVGHSNTINAIAAALGAPHPGMIDDATYDNLFVVTVGASGKATLLKARY